MSLAPFVQIVARGKGRGRSMCFEEAHDAMTLILNNEAAPEAIGALFMVMRMRGETAEEIAGFTAALRAHVEGALPPADLDWPTYAAGRSRGAPLFLLSARLVAQAGFTVSMHGWNSHQSKSASVRDALEWAGPQVLYDALEDLCPRAFDLLRLRDVLGLRSCFNTVLRMWNPSGAGVSVQGVFHPSYRGLQTSAAEILGDKSLVVIKGGGGEFERHPAKDISVFGWYNQKHISETATALLNKKRRLHEGQEAYDLADLWRGESTDNFAIATVTGTAAIALWSLKAARTMEDAHQLAAILWRDRFQPERLSA